MLMECKTEPGHDSAEPGNIVFGSWFAIGFVLVDWILRTDKHWDHRMSIAIRYYELWCYRELVVKLVALLNPAITSQTKFQTNQYSYNTLKIDMSIHVFCSSVGQSERLLTVRSEVRALPGENFYIYQVRFSVRYFSQRSINTWSWSRSGQKFIIIYQNLIMIMIWTNFIVIYHCTDSNRESPAP